MMWHTESQVRSRIPSRVVAAILLALTVLGAGGSTLTAPLFLQTIRWTRRKRRSAPRRLPERRESLTGRRYARVQIPLLDSLLPATLFHLWIFQRPPPNAAPVFA